MPTVGEAGLPGTECTIPFGISVPGGTPRAVVSGSTRRSTKRSPMPAMRAKLQELGFLPVGGRAEAYAEVVATEIAKWRKVIKDSKIPAPT